MRTYPDPSRGSAPPRVLHVEDQPADRLLCREALRCAGDPISLVQVQTLAEADHALREPFDLVLLDMDLPDGTGLSVLTRILGAARDAPVVVLTGAVDTGLGPTLVAAGAEDFLNKSEIGGGRLRRVIALALARRSLRPRADRALARVEKMPEGPPMGGPTVRTLDLEPEASHIDLSGVLPYEVEVRLGGESGSHAVVRGPHSRVTIDAGLRVSFLWVLAEKLERDLKAGVVRDEAGWLNDAALSVAVWGGKAARRQNRSRLSVLVHRVRRDLEEGGLDSGAIQKRRLATRLCVASATAR